MPLKLLCAATAAATLALPTAAGATPDTGGPEYAAIAAYANIVTGPVTVNYFGQDVPFALDLYNWGQLAMCETGGNWQSKTGPFKGGLQFWPATWRSVGGTGDPADAPIAEQIERARLVLDRDGWGAWPGCTRRLGWR